MNLKWFVLPVLALAVSVASGSWAKSTQEQAPARSQVMGRIVIVGYKPKPGKAEALRSLASTHIQRLRAEGLVTPREAIIMEASDGTITRYLNGDPKRPSNPPIRTLPCERFGKSSATYVIMFPSHPSQKQNSYFR